MSNNRKRRIALLIACCISIEAVMISTLLLSCLPNPIPDGSPSAFAESPLANYMWQATDLPDDLQQSSSIRTWVGITPLECLQDPWEVAWLEAHGMAHAAYPREQELVPEVIGAIDEYYRRRGIRIFDIRSEWWKDTVGTCTGCSCTEGYALYLLVDNSDVDRMRELGYVALQSVPSEAQQLETLQQIVAEIPSPPQAQLIYRSYTGYRQCKWTSAEWLYATDASIEDVLDFYRDFLQEPLWVNDAETPRLLSGHKLFPEFSIEGLKFRLIVSRNDDIPAIWYTPREATRSAIEAGQTVYILWSSHTQDNTILNCPPDGWWQLEALYYD